MYDSVASQKKEIGQRLKEVRSQQKLTQKEFAKILGVSNSYITQVENGIKMVGAELISSLKREFKVDCAWLLTGMGDMYMSLPRNNVSHNGAGNVLLLLDNIKQDQKNYFTSCRRIEKCLAELSEMLKQNKKIRKKQS